MRILEKKRLWFFLIFILLFFAPLFDGHHFLEAEKGGFIFLKVKEIPELTLLQENTFFGPLNLTLPEAPLKLEAIITAYSSTPWQTDEDPYITASGNLVREGIVANNFFPLGTKIKIPEIFGEKIFVVEDRMHWLKGKYQIDIWFPDYWQALNFGVKRTYIEVLD